MWRSQHPSSLSGVPASSGTHTHTLTDPVPASMFVQLSFIHEPDWLGSLLQECSYASLKKQGFRIIKEGGLLTPLGFAETLHPGQNRHFWRSCYLLHSHISSPEDRDTEVNGGIHHVTPHAWKYITLVTQYGQCPPNNCHSFIIWENKVIKTTG